MFIPLWVLIPLAVVFFALIIAAAQNAEANMQRTESSRGWREEQEADPYL